MVEFSDYMQFTDDDLEEVKFYNYAKDRVGETKLLANGEYFECMLNQKPYRFLHATFNGNSWYEIYQIGG